MVNNVEYCGRHRPELTNIEQQFGGNKDYAERRKPWKIIINIIIGIEEDIVTMK